RSKPPCWKERPRWSETKVHRLLCPALAPHSNCCHPNALSECQIPKSRPPRHRSKPPQLRQEDGCRPYRLRHSRSARCSRQIHSSGGRVYEDRLTKSVAECPPPKHRLRRPRSRRRECYPPRESR